MEPSATLLLVRHGHTLGNGAHAVLMGGGSDLPLSARGARQAASVAMRLRGEAITPVVYTSPLVRARATARAVAERAQVRIVGVEALREIDCGELDGLPIREVRERFPDLWARNEAQADPDFRWPGGESYRDFRERCLSAAAALGSCHPGRRVVAVTHTGVISQLVGAALGTCAARWSEHRAGNASLTVLTWSAGRIEVVTFDDRQHLEPEDDDR